MASHATLRTPLLTLATALLAACPADDTGDDGGSSGVADSSGGHGSSGGHDSSGGHGSSDAGSSESTGAQTPSMLEQCDAPSPCDPFSQDPGTSQDMVHPALECAIGQALAAIADGTTAELSASFCDIGCSGSDLLLLGDGTAYLQSWTSTDVTSYEPAQLCTLQPASYFEPCVGQPLISNGCVSFVQWVTACETVATVSCP